MKVKDFKTVVENSELGHTVYVLTEDGELFSAYVTKSGHRRDWENFSESLPKDD